MKKLLLLSALAAVSFALSGCGWMFGDKGIFRDRGDDYRRAQVSKPLVVPPDLSPISGDEDFSIPSVAYTAPLEGKFVVPRPEPLEGNPDAERVKIQTLGSTSWILVEATPGEIWPRVRQFLSTNQLGVARADATAGIIETAWLQPKAQDTQRERYRFRIEQGVQRGSGEVYVLQADARSGDNWPQHSSDGARETEMIKSLAQFIADNGSTGAVSMLAQRGIESKGKVFLSKRAGENSYIRLNLPSDRAWASLTTALPKAGFSVDDVNHSENQLWVRYTPPKIAEDEPGWWSRFWSWVFSSDEDAVDNEKIVYVVHMQAEANAADGVRINLSRQDGKPIAAGAEEELLNRIKNKLS